MKSVFMDLHFPFLKREETRRDWLGRKKVVTLSDAPIGHYSTFIHELTHAEGYHTGANILYFTQPDTVSFGDDQARNIQLVCRGPDEFLNFLDAVANLPGTVVSDKRYVNRAAITVCLESYCDAPVKEEAETFEEILDTHDISGAREPVSFKSGWLQRQYCMTGPILSTLKAHDELMKSFRENEDNVVAWDNFHFS